jgi:hypothetical protein
MFTQKLQIRELYQVNLLAIQEVGGWTKTSTKTVVSRNAS